MSKSALLEALVAAPPAELLAALERLVGAGRVYASTAAKLYHHIRTIQRRRTP